MIKNNRCFAIDYSGSTSGVSFYHKSIYEILEKKYETGDEIIIWDSASKYISYEKYMEINRKCEGNGGTTPSCIFDSLFNKHKKIHYKEFVLITDGQVWENDVEKVDEIIQKNKSNFITDYVEVYFIGRKKDANLSVSCPFTRECSNKIILKSVEEPYKDEIIMEVDKNDLNLCEIIKGISNMEDFNSNYDMIEKSFISRLIGTKGDIELRKEVLLMKNRIIKNNANKKENLNTKLDDLLLKERNFKEAEIELSRNLNVVTTSEFEQKINLLIRMSDGALKQIFNLGELQTFRTNTATTTKVVEVDEVDTNIESSVKDSKFECPISCENETDPIILITLPENENYLKPLLIGFEKETLEKIINCPLNALYNKEFIEKFKLYIDHVISLKTLREAENKGYPFQFSPFTRKTIVGAITLGETEEHVNCANYNLMKLLTGGKNLGDRNLWFFVLWILVKNNVFPYLNDIEPFIKAQVIYRMKNYRTSISLSGLGNLPQNKVFYATAAWSCLMTPFIINKIPAGLNLFNVHIVHYKELVEIVKLFNFELPNNFEKFANRMEVFSYLLYYFKKNPKLIDNFKNGLTYNSIIINVDENSPLKAGGIVGELYIPIDGEINEENRIKCLEKLPKICKKLVNEKKITINEISWLMSYINISKQLNDINIRDFISFEETNIINTKVSDKWRHYDDNVDAFENIKISPKTMRPYYYVDNGVTWMDALSKIFPKDFCILSTDKQYGNFITDYEKFPTLDEYILCLYRKYKNHQTLPRFIEKLSKFVFNRYEKVLTGITPLEFKKIYNKSAPISERIIMEKN